MNGSKRKQLAVPMVALMVCAVAFIGIGYALTSQHITSENSTAGGQLAVEADTESDTALFSGVKIPYATIYDNGNTTHKVEAGNYKLYEGEIRVTDNTGLYTKYNITVNIEGLSIAGANTSITLSEKTGSTSTNTGSITTSEKTIKITIGLNFTNEKSFTNEDINSLTVNNISVKIYAEGTA